MALPIHFISLLGLILLAVNGAHCSSIDELSALQAWRDDFDCGSSKNSACAAQCNGNFSHHGLLLLALFGDCSNFFNNNTFNLYPAGAGPFAICNDGSSCDACFDILSLAGVLPSGSDNSINMCCSKVLDSGPGGDGTDQSSDAPFICSSYKDNCSDCIGTATCNCGCYGKCNSNLDEYNDS